MKHYKYPRTMHFPWSPGSTSDDKFMENTSNFVGKTVVITEKMDGENTNMYSDKIHARSIDSKDHESRHWVKGLWGNIKNEIPEGWRICGENLYAKHSIHYKNLKTYFMVFSVWDDNNNCLSWEETLKICEMLNLTTVPVIGICEFNEQSLISLGNDVLNLESVEGYVVRNVNEFNYVDFDTNVGKFVRPNHVTTDQHWMLQKVVPNLLK